MTVQTTWTIIGRDYNATPEQVDLIEREIAALEWHDVIDKPPIAMPMMQGFAINHLARETRGTLIRVAYNGTLGPMGFYGLEKRYSNGTARNYYVDDGLGLTAVRSDFTPSEDTASVR